MDDNKIELVVELDTKKAEKQAEDLNDALVDGVRDANKEFTKYSNDVNKNLNKIKKQMDSTFNGVQFGNKLANGLSKALSGIKNQISKIMGNINVNTSLKTTSTTSSSNSNNDGGQGVSSMGASLVTGGAIGSQLAKTLSMLGGDKFIKPIDNAIAKVKEMSKVLTQVKIGEHFFEPSTIVQGLDNLASKLSGGFPQAVQTANSMLKILGDELNNTEVSMERLQVISEITESLINNMFGQVDYSKASKGVIALTNEVQRVKNTINSMKQQGAIDSTIVSPNAYAGIKTLVSELNKATTGFNKFKLYASKAFSDISNSSSGVASKISGVFPKITSALSPITNKVKEFSKALVDGFKNPTPHLERMKNKIVEWANKHKQATDKVKSANKSVGSSFKSLLQQVLPFASLYGIFNGVKNSVTSYADSLQQASKFAYTFGDATSDMNQWLETLDASYNMSKSEVMDFSSNLYRMGLNMNMTQQDAMGMAQQMSELAINLKAFTGSEQAFEAVASAIRGETDAIQTLGFALDADSVKAHALSMGLDASSESCLVLARQSLLLEQGSAILGYASQNVNSLSFQMALLRENVGKLANAFGNMFGGLLTACLPALNALVSAVTKAVNAIANAINSILALFGISAKGSGFSGSIGGGGIAGSLGGIADTIGGVSDGIAGLADDLDGAGAGVADSLGSGAESAKEIAKELGFLGIDEINTIKLPDASGSGSGGSGGSGASGLGSGGSGGLGSGGSGLGDLGGGSGFELSQTSSVLEEVNGELTKFQKGFLAIWNELVDGFSRHKDAIISAWQNLKANLNALGQEMADFFVSAWQNGLDRTVNLIGGVIGAIVETALNITNSVVEVISGLFDHLNPNNNENTQKFIESINYLLEQIEGFITDAGKWFSQFATACQPFINNLGDIAMIVGGILATVLGDALQLIRDFMNSWAGKALIEGVATALEWLSGALESCLGFIQDHITFFEALALGIGGAVLAFNLINGAITIWNGLMLVFNSIGAIASGVCTVLGGAIAFLTSPIGLVVLAIGALIAIGVALYKNWDEVKAKCQEVWTAVVEWFNEAGIDIEGILKGILTYIKNTFNDIWSFIKTVWNSIVDIFKTVWNSIVNIVTTAIKGVWNIIKSTVSLILSIIQTQLALIVAVFTGDWGKVKDITSKLFSAVKTQISTILNSVWDVIKSIGKGIANTFTSVWTGIVNTVASKIQLVYNSVSSKFNAVWGVVKGVVDKLKSAFNFKWSLPSLKLPRISVTGGEAPFGIGGKGSLPKFSIRWASEGLLFSKPTLLGVGDASHGMGRQLEAVLPISKLWTQLDQQFAKQNAMLSGGRNSQPINITLQMDGREIGKATFKNFEELSRLGIIDLSTLI